jgi:hypothetical protein
MADVFDVFQFNRENIIQWSKDFLMFFRSPRKYVAELSARSGAELLPQFLFYFLAYCASFLFVSTDSLKELWKPAILGLASTIWTVILFCFTTWIALGKLHLKQILIFVLSLSFFTNSIGLIVFSYFINVEDFTYRLLYNTWMSIASLVLVFGFSFIIQPNVKKGFKLMLVNYVVMNLLVLGFQRISFDKYTNMLPMQWADPIYSEYIELVTPLKQKEKIPVQRFYSVIMGNVSTGFTLQDIVNGTNAEGGTDQNNVFREEINQYQSYLEKQKENLKFTRNKEIAKLWLRYYQTISTQINIKIKDTNELKGIKDLELLMSDSLGRAQMYLSPINFGDSIFVLQYQLKEYHNNIIKSSTISDIPTNISLVCINFLDLLLDQGIYLLLNEGKGRPYKEKFNAPKEGWF